ncbi:MAG: hypothetical protein WCR54_08070 [Clostridia bacterium]
MDTLCGYWNIFITYWTNNTINKEKGLNKYMTREKTNIFFITIGIIALMVFAVVIGANVDSNVANAGVLRTMTISQKEDSNVEYINNSYIGTDGHISTFGDDENSFWESLEIKLDNQLISDVDSQNFIVTNVNAIDVPKTYHLIANVNYDGNTYNNVAFDAVINKKTLNINLVLSTEDVEEQTNLVIDEGVKYTAKIIYYGFANNDNESTLIYPPIIPSLPKKPINNYEIRAKDAYSDRYLIVYGSARITINSCPKTEIKFDSGTTNLLTLEGSFNPYAELEFLDIGVNNTSVEYTQIDNNVNTHYLGNEILKKYEPVGSYRINLIIDGNKEEMVQTKVIVKMSDEMKKHEEFLIIAHTNDGFYSVITAKENDGYLEFTTSDLGDFMIISPISGLTTTQMAIAILCGVVGLFAIILFFALFRRKY